MARNPKDLPKTGEHLLPFRPHCLFGRKKQNSDYMNVLLSGSSQLRLLSAAVFACHDKPAKDLKRADNERETGGTPESLDAIIMALHSRANATTPTLQRILEIRPPSHWGLNE